MRVGADVVWRAEESRLVLRSSKINGNRLSVDGYPASKGFETQMLDGKLRLKAQQSVPEMRVLILGPSSAGKSTLMKRTALMAEEESWGADSRFKYASLTLDAVKETLLSNMLDEVHCVLSPDDEKILSREEWEAVAAMLRDSSDPCGHRGFFLENGWNLLQRTYKSVDYQTDWCRVRQRTTGITELRLLNEKLVFVDLGGPRTERKKWMHCSTNVSQVWFAVSLTGMLRALYDDETQNEFSESMNVLHHVSTSKWFRSTQIVIFLTHMDDLLDLYARFPDIIEAKISKLLQVPFVSDFPAGSEARLRLLVIAAFSAEISRWRIKFFVPKSFDVAVINLMDRVSGSAATRWALGRATPKVRAVAHELTVLNEARVPDTVLEGNGLGEWKFHFFDVTMKWTFRTHMFFPRFFREEVMTLLLWQKRTRCVSKDVLIEHIIPYLASMHSVQHRAALKEADDTDPFAKFDVDAVAISKI